MAILSFTAVKDSDDITTLDIVDTDGNPIDLTALGTTKVTATICESVYKCNPLVIDVNFLNDEIFPVFGDFQAKPGVYFPKIQYTLPNGDIKTLAAKGFLTQIKLTMVC